MKQFLLVLVMVIFFSCSSKINQYNVRSGSSVKTRDGKWIEKQTINDNDTLISKGFYKNGKKIGIWKTFLNNTLFQKEKYKKNTTKIITYFPDGKIREKGQTKTEMKNNSLHWYYFGDWKYYNNKGKLEYIKRYNNGTIDSISIKK